MNVEQKSVLLWMIDNLIEKISERFKIPLNAFTQEFSNFCQTASWSSKTNSDPNRLAVGVLMGARKWIAEDRPHDGLPLGVSAFASEFNFDRDIESAFYEIERKYSEYR